MAGDAISESDLTTRLLQKIGDYWTDLSRTSSRDIDSEKFWEPYDCAQIMMTHAFELLQLCSNIPSIPIVEIGTIAILDDYENRYLRIKWGEVNVTIIFDILKSDALNQMKNIHNFLPETNIFVVLLPFLPGENECRIASDLRDDGTSIILMCPTDFNALISAKWNLGDLLIYKVFRMFLLGKQDIEGVYEKYAWPQFKTILDRTEISPPELSLDDALKNLDLKITDLLEHPTFKDLQKSLHTNNFVMISGPSSCGKTSLALRAAHNIHINLGRDIWYFDVGSARAEDAIHLGIRLLSRGIKAKELLLVLDDLQTNLDMARQMILFLSLFQRLVFGNKLQTLGVCWPDFKPEFKKTGINFITFDINASQLSCLMIDHFGKRLNKQQLNIIRKTAGDDLLVLKLSLIISNELNRYLTPKELAEELWKRMRHSCGIPPKVMGRAVLVASIIGQYECEVTKTFLIRQTQIRESEIDELAKAKLIRYHRGQINAGHRSFCTLMSDYLGGYQEHWKWFRRHNRPSTQENIMLEFILSLPPSQIWPILKAIHTHVGFKVSGNIFEKEFSLAEYWQNLDYLLDRVIGQQKDDPTWGGDISSAAFAIEALSNLGMFDEAKKSISFLRNSYWTNNDGLFVKVNEIATFYDFNQIKGKMKTEDLSKKRQAFADLAEEIDVNLFHENWARGIILCVESAFGEKTESELAELAILVEKFAHKSGYFYPARVPWCTARVLMGLGTCGRRVHNSNVVKKAAEWLLRSKKDGGVFYNGMWEAGTGGWNTPIETTALCIIALVSVDIDKNDPRLIQAINYLIAEKRKWVEQDSEIDGVLAIEAYSMMGKELDEISTELRTLLKWMKSKALWLYATKHADETLSQSPKIAQIAASLIRLTWKRMSSDLPNVLKAFALSKTESKLYGSFGELEPPVPNKEPSKSIFAEVGITPDKVIGIIEKFESVNLSEFYAVNGYTKFNERERNNLKDLFVKICEAISNRSDKRENYLIWGPPGSGKTYLIERIVEALKDHLKYWKLDLSKIEREEFLSKLHDVQKGTDSINVICLIDEIDSKKKEAWSFEILLSFLDANQYTANSLIWILAGSSEENIIDFKNSLVQRFKGKDLTSRIPQENIIEIPPPTLEDRLLLILSYIKRLSAYRNFPIKHIEKFALFYLMISSELANPRQLEDFIHAGIKRVIMSEDRLKYDDLFYAGDLKNKEFWRNYEVVTTQLTNKYITIT